LALGWCAGWLLAGAPRRLPRGRPPADLRVSVVIPARDEAPRLAGLLAAVRASEPAPHEIVVADDGSTDGTAAAARDGGAVLVPVVGEVGWTGKARACWVGAAAATGDVLVFLDADTRPSPGLVPSLAAAAVASGGVVSAQPRHRVERPYELLSAGCALVTLLGAGTGGPPRARWWRGAVAFGPCIAVTRAAYERVGGHRAVRGEIAEDIALAGRAARAAVAVEAYLGGDLVSYRMYPDGPGQLVEGWSKNLALGAGAIPRLRLAACIAWLTAALVAAAPGRRRGGRRPSIAPYAAFAAQSGVMLRRVGSFGPVPVVAYPVTLASFLGLFTRSAVLTRVRRAVVWRGRVVPVGG
jgi:4,4'-diaponeurosporenoate glycosyltransferase